MHIGFKLIKDYSANGKIWSIHFLRFSNVIDISHGRFLNGKNGGEKHISSVKKEVLSRKIIQKRTVIQKFSDKNLIVVRFVFVL